MPRPPSAPYRGRNSYTYDTCERLRDLGFITWDEYGVRITRHGLTALQDGGYFG